MSKRELFLVLRNKLQQLLLTVREGKISLRCEEQAKITANSIYTEKGMSYNPGTPGYGIPPTPGPMYGDLPPATPGPIYGNSGASYSYAPATPGPQISYGHTPGPASNMRGPPSNAVGSVKRMNVADQQPQSVQSEYPPATPRSAMDNGVQSPQIQNIVATI
ncbi:unnamed protein product [Oikopleura dioica]|uniref:Uncharacterized protein n=1 Tax=Oikopleura dioica TaxID=34765 RepID=E4WXH5_OIKDI|nr:unnamed protein product [Oikopleura dioica]